MSTKATIEAGYSQTLTAGKTQKERYEVNLKDGTIQNGGAARALDVRH
jgi:hypothetical protein